MDCDLQEPPEEIARLYAKAQEGYDIVRATREGGATRRFGACRRRCTGACSPSARAARSSSRRCRSSRARSSTRSCSCATATASTSSCSTGWASARRRSASPTPSARASSPSAYGLRELVRVALDGMFFRTTVLLRWIVLLGFVVALLGGLLGVYAVYSRYVEDTPPGYTSIVVLLVLLSGFIIISLGVVGLVRRADLRPGQGAPAVRRRRADRRRRAAAALMDDALERFTFDVEERHWWYRGRRAVLEAMLDGLGPLPAARGAGPARILDAGCGSGRNMVALARRGAVTGIELASQSLEVARARGARPGAAGLARRPAALRRRRLRPRGRARRARARRRRRRRPARARARARARRAAARDRAAVRLAVGRARRPRPPPPPLHALAAARPGRRRAASRPSG